MGKPETSSRKVTGVPFWMVAIIIASLGALSYKISHDVAISELLFLLLLGWGAVKLIPIAFRLIAILAILLIFGIVVLAWAGVLFGN